VDLMMKDRAYLVTGGSRGLGFATAQALVDEGARVVVSGRDAAVLEDSVLRLGSERAAGVVADNADPSSADLLVSETVERFGRLDGVVISVGGPPAGGVLEATDAQWRDAFEAVFLGAIRLARTAAAQMNDGGAILFVLSTSVRSPIAELGISNGLRPGLAMAAKSLADELGPCGIRVNGVLPGRIATDRLRDVQARSGEEFGREAVKAIPLRRFGEPGELGKMAAVLMSPVASYVTGTVLAVDGGMLRAL
jgi:3-oxoacyl-[acyl-carrier protein] reductase